ncbi:hypothetical protein A4G16_02015 [Mannheimia granulomatis]|uniref:Adhesin n=2 Tax=Mannheimia granulomatis TaxID=85402 RepID=A0A6G8JGX4_9PAST|nr:YadA-like family protein [Mannheimia granulomatis]QIM66233.1 hypothetical protein A4G16_02015 [Mannheimia granulomatis]
MNTIYKVILNKSTGAFMAVAEFAKGQGKTKSVKLTAIAAAITTAIIPSIAYSAVIFTNTDGGTMIIKSDTGEPTATSISLNSPADRAIALGNNVTASATDSIAIGTNTVSSSRYDMAIGSYSTATGGASTAINGGRAEGELSLAIGSMAIASGYHSSSIGFQSSAEGIDTIAYGTNAHSYGMQSVSLGGETTARGNYSLALGQSATALHEGSVALGFLSTTEEAVGTDSATINGITYSGFAGNTPTATVSIGTEIYKRTITNVAAGQITETSTDAINGSQLYIVAKGLSKQNYFHVNDTNAEQTGNDTNLDSVDGIGGAKGINALAAGIKAQANKQGDVAIGTNALASGVDTNSATATSGSALAVGTNSVATGIASVALGQAAQATKNGALALGSFANATGSSAVALGRGAISEGESSSALGAGSTATGKYSIASGVQSKAVGIQSIALGRSAVSAENDAIAIGSASNASKQDSIAIGTSAQANVAGGVALGNNSVASIDKGAVGANPLNANINTSSPTWTSTAAAISVGDIANGVTRQITSVAAGTADTDAVNVAQLKAVAEKTKSDIQDVANNAGFNLTTSASAGEVSGTTIEKIATGETVTLDAGKNIKVTQTGNTISVATKDDVSFNNVNVTDTLTVGPVTINQVGINANNTKIVGVKDGDISPTSTDAVNGSQLYAIKQEISNVVSNVKDTSASTSAGSNAITVTKGATTKVGNTDVTDYAVDLSQSTKDDIKKGVDAKNIVDNKGLTFSTDNGSTNSQKLGSTVKVKGDRNITTKASGNQVEVTLNHNVKVDSVTTGNTVMNNNGIIINNADPNRTVSLTQNGLNNGGNRITNVARGVNATDAVNVSQLRDSEQSINNKMNRLDKNLRAGIAGATAMSFLQRPNEAGKSLVSAAAGGYKGESAVAVGYARNSDNNKVSIKLGLGVNSRSDVSYGGSIGYQW